ncbi:hypothetical protein A2765_01335 [Candidatus Kaiserbacteria bacterium RIFCSPHIGHO2_01_FULL_56_24]|uniref:MaoC-like domain-containing protein n=1 Tax=Candidatus Kaiserbacteria bacterium RIFCSPHIGHO2_01_FULL_56_24 TaxID=1798487 RepID=A0A1F6DHE5_9BACT|nr:MAG: hypothetical protein A2765_01335 [Candidatus Kaiserbacteria bacterium RIFCSPHIGHO2_01_FULL_56_24]
MLRQDVYDPSGFLKAFWRPIFELFATVAGDTTFYMQAPLFADDIAETPYESLKVGAKASAEFRLWWGGLLYYFRSCGYWGAAQETGASHRKTNAHVGLIEGAVYALIERELPGPGSKVEEVRFRFDRHHPAFIDDTLTVSVEITSVDAQERGVVLAAEVTNQHGEIIMQGIVSVLR